jgi:hypothetical protein
VGGESITIIGKDFDPGCIVDFRLHPFQTLIPAVVTQFIGFPDNLQHVTITTPAIPEQSGIPGDITFFDRRVTIRVTNPPYGEFSERLQCYVAEFLDTAPKFTEIGEVLFFPERLTMTAGNSALFETFTANSDICRQTYEFLPDPAGAVDYKCYGDFDHRPYDPRYTKKVGSFGNPKNFTAYITRGQILRVVLETFPGSADGWSVTLRDDVGLDAFQGMGVGAGPVPGAPYEFIPTITDGYGASHLVTLHDHMRFTITGAGPGTPPTTYGLVHVYLGLD